MSKSGGKKTQAERDREAKEMRMRQDHPLNRSLAARSGTGMPAAGKKKK